MRRRLKWFLVVLAVIAVVVGSIFAFMPRVEVHGEGTLAISNTVMLEPPQLDIVSISDIPAYGVIEPSGCGEFKGRVKLRIDCFLKPSSSYYGQYGGAEVVDTSSPEYLDGYKGEVDKETGEPLDPVKYQEWLDSLPTVWQNNSFHSHFIYYDTSVLDDTIKAKIASVTEYFYAFHKYCWDNDKEFIPEWQKVPKVAGTIRDVFIAGDSSPPNKTACEVKANDVLSRLPDFDTRQFEENPSPPPPLNIGEKGTIDVGFPADDYNTTWNMCKYTSLSEINPANADGEIDTVDIYANANLTACYVGMFYNTGGNDFKCRDSESVGNVTAGDQPPITGLTIDVLTGDLIGCKATNAEASGRIECYHNETDGVYYVLGEFIDPNDETTYSFLDAYSMALYGTGTEAGGFDIGNAPESENLGTLEVNTTYYAKGTAPNNPVEDGDCTFTVTNNGDACDLDMKISDFTGGVGWNIDATPGANEAKVTAYYSGQDPSSGLVLANTDAEFYDGLASSGTIKWDFALLTGTSFGDGVEKSATLTITAVAED